MKTRRFLSTIALLSTAFTGALMGAAQAVPKVGVASVVEGEPIGIPRLLARPTATLSLEAQERRELRQKLFGD